MDLFFAEAFEYVATIQGDKMHEYLMQSYIAQNPHSKEPRKMIEQLQAQADILTGVSRYETDPNAAPEKDAFEKLKKALNKK